MIRFAVIVILLFGLIWGAIAVALNVGVFVPAGEQIVYVSKHTAARWDIHLLDIDRSLSANLTGSLLPEAARNRYPAWSPDGRLLAFATDLRRNNDLLLLHIASGTLRYITDWRWDDIDPSWSLAGRARIAYVTSNGANWDIGIIDLGMRQVPQLASTGGTVTVQDRLILPRRGNEFAPRWSPDGRFLLYQSDGGGIADLYISSPDGDTLQLTSGLMVENGGVWSPDGNRIAFAGGRRNAREVYILDLQSGDLINITKSPRDDYDPVWSPDGTRLVFVSDRDGDSDLYMVEIDATVSPLTIGLPRQLTDNTHPDYEPAWSPDGTRIVYTAAPGRTSEIYLLTVDGDAYPQRLTANGLEDWYPLWRPVAGP